MEENRLAAARLPSGMKRLTLETTLTHRDAGTAKLKFACANLLTVLLDGRTIIDCPERTVDIPAVTGRMSVSARPDRSSRRLSAAG